ncbi:DDE-type integrase/transposase/recombinase [Streptomyces sp. NPDC058914]|uniref:DDE-type integrase/transposase/recombinase n=1 Tax=Streptomyces sp. NPDC058914 TaxID=3346671 RepID=UPI0036C3F127
MPQRTLTTPGSTDQFVLTERPALTLTDRYRPLPDGMDHTHLTVIPAHQVATGDTWHLDEVFVKVSGGRHYLWRAVDQDGTTLRLPGADPSASCRSSARSHCTSGPVASMHRQPVPRRDGPPLHHLEPRHRLAHRSTTSAPPGPGPGPGITPSS